MNFGKEWIEQMIELQRKSQQMQPDWVNQFSDMLKNFTGAWTSSDKTPKAELENLGAWQDFWNTREIEKERDSGPLLTIMEGHRDITVSGILPGVEQGNLNIKLRGHTLLISGESKRISIAQGTPGIFSRVIKLPVEVEAQSAKATYRNSYLEIRFRKKQQNDHIIHVEFL
ncbi:Molecular chaperone IbpA, HSP20 family [Desulfotomaculum arcticum]|uniref:Molecular chaperone IbpA, HSP20 family n=1 Tax=Desulfotruncus arcticus DSM 17038 TaxID=1121424 RepID=A0A1I2VGT1_9FIRM|nr:Hsp20/alpha crystallin family protein [Desulfotruncus arcticus]SFG88283.1 Molecular chaperone IbpA, HSP20 family [Desulfotomaculum arcticum] [Desulfotruncus arcticus DSM 17038]